MENKNCKIIIEVGSTVTKADKFDGEKVEKLKGKTIEFKKHFLESGSLNEGDVQELIEFVLNLKDTASEIYICGTSIFRTLVDEQKMKFLSDFKRQTGCEFHIISQEQESEFTVKGATRFVNGKVCVLIGGGGSTEIAIYEDEIKENVNSKFGVIDIMHEFPDLAEDFAKTDIEDVKTFIKSKINLPNKKADVLILAGGEHEKFARLSGIKYNKNILYEDLKSPIMMDINLRVSETRRYYEAISLDEIRNRVDDPRWWYATRAMCAVVLVVAEAVGAKYIVPTDISMVYGLIKK